MKIYILILLLFFFSSNNVFSQVDEKIALESLEFLDQKFYLHFKKMEESILISINEEKFIYNEYVNKQSLSSLSFLRFQYDLKKIDKNKYSFLLTAISVYSGTFEVVKKNGQNCFINLQYIQRTD